MSAADYDITVSGGTATAEASYEDMRWVANRALQLAEDLESKARMVRSVIYDPDFGDSMTASSDTYWAVRDAVDYAVEDAGGMFAAAAMMERRHDDLNTAVANYEDADSTMASIMDSVGNWFLGASQLAWWQGAYIGTMTGVHGEDWLVEHPGLLQETLAALPNSLIVPLSFSAYTGGLAELWGDGTTGSARRIGVNALDNPVAAATPPTGLGNLFQALSNRNTAAGDGNDEIDVRRVEQPDGTVSYIVDIPGTADWNLPDGGLGLNDNPNDLTTNLHAIAGETTTREEAIAQALQDAGASSTDPVMLVGHSQGGIVAAQAAADTADGAFDYNVTHVITAGSPISNADVPPGVQVLALENQWDIIPTLDGADNPDATNITTVRFDNQTDTIGGNHGLGSDLGSGSDENYMAVAEVLDQSGDPTVQAYVDSASDFILTDPTGVQVTVTGYELTRE